MKPFEYVSYNRKTTFRKSLSQNVVYYLYNFIPVLVVGIAAVLVILIVIDRPFFILLVNSLIYDKLIIKYEMIGLFLNSVFSSIIPIPTELITSMLLLSKLNKILILLYWMLVRLLVDIWHTLLVWGIIPSYKEDWMNS